MKMNMIEFSDEELRRLYENHYNVPNQENKGI
jgi:hypothetical protein